jgi:hypothetical protein
MIMEEISMQHATSLFIAKLNDCAKFVLETWSAFSKNIHFPDLEVDIHTSDIDPVLGRKIKDMFVLDGIDKDQHIAFERFKKEVLVYGFASIIDPEYCARLRTGDYDSKEPRFALFCNKINTQVDSAILQTVQLRKLAKDGIHELCVNDEQAVGMTAMRFNIKSDDFIIPVKSMLVHLPRTIFKHDIFQEASEIFLSNIKESATFSMATQQTTNLWIDYERQFRKSGDSVAVLVQAFDGPNKNIVARFNLGGSMEFKIFCDKNHTFEEDLQNSGLPEMARLIFRAALSAVLISTMKPEVVQTREVERSVEKIRRHLIAKTEKITNTKIKVPSYTIFQPSMKTYQNKTITSGTGTSPSTITLKPVFVWGFWRRQPHGPNNSLRKLKWIEAYIRNKDLLLGDNPQIITSSKFTQPEDVIENEIDCSHS